MKHFVCIGDCVGVASNPGVCTTEGCTHEGKSLIACRCDDEMHDEAFAKVTAHNVDQEPSLSSTEGGDEDLIDIDDVADDIEAPGSNPLE